MGNKGVERGRGKQQGSLSSNTRLLEHEGNDEGLGRLMKRMSSKESMNMADQDHKL